MKEKKNSVKTGGALEDDAGRAEAAARESDGGSREGEAAKEGARVSKYTKQQLMASARYRNRRDLLSAVLDPEKLYTVADTDRLIGKFMKGKVK